MYYVYALRSLKDGKYYFGQSHDPVKSAKLHNSGKVKSTRLRKPFLLVGYKNFKTRNEARWFEYLLKKHGDRKEIY